MHQLPGTRVVRTEDPLFLTRGAVCTEDLVDERLAGAVHATFLRSQVAHGRVAHSDPASDLPTAPLALGGSVVVQGAGGRRRAR